MRKGVGIGYVYGGSGGLQVFGGSRSFVGIGYVTRKTENTSGGISGLSSIEKFTYSSSTAALTGKYLSAVRGYLTASGTPAMGFIYGGGEGAGFVKSVSTVDVFDYSTAVRAIASFKCFPRNLLSACGNNTKGLLQGGQQGTIAITILERISYSTNSMTDTGVRTPVMLGPVCIGNDATNFGLGGHYYTAGYNQSTVQESSAVIRSVNYSTEVLIINNASLLTPRGQANGVGALSYGYVCFGTCYYKTSSAYVIITTVEKLDYSTVTMSVVFSGGSKMRSASFGNSTKGFIAGDGSQCRISSVWMLDYTTDNMVNDSFLTASRGLCAASSDSTPGEQAA